MRERRRQRTCKLKEDKALWRAVFAKLKRGWSPEQIAGRLAYERGYPVISHESIYAYIYSDEGKYYGWHRYLRKKRRCRQPKVGRQKRLKIPNRVSIHERPAVIETREEFGHWEGDLMMFQRSQKGNLLTLRERKSRYCVFRPHLITDSGNI